MARDNSTSRTRFAQSKFVTKTNKLSNSDPSGPVLESCVVNFSDFNQASSPHVNASGASFLTFINEILPITMETLRSHVDYLLSLPIPVAEKNRLLLKYWAMEYRLEAVCLLLDEAQENGMVIVEADIDPLCFDFSGFYLPEFNVTDINSSESD
jgi:hypothetical protein